MEDYDILEDNPYDMDTSEIYDDVVPFDSDRAELERLWYE